MKNIKNQKKFHFFIDNTVKPCYYIVKLKKANSSEN